MAQGWTVSKTVLGRLSATEVKQYCKSVQPNETSGMSHHDHCTLLCCHNPVALSRAGEAGLSLTSMKSRVGSFECNYTNRHRDERMPKLFVPHKSDAHRLACTSLYRALLKQCNDLTSTTAPTGYTVPSCTLQNLVRYRFQRDRKLQSPTNIKDALTRGHSHFALLYSVNAGSQSALTQFLQILKTTLKDVESTAAEKESVRERRPPLKVTPKALHIQRQSTKTLNRVPPDSLGLSAHPLPLSALKSHSRVVPQLINGQKNIPFLRYGRQSVFLSRILRQKMNWKERMHAQLRSLEVNYDLGLAEDDWDRSVRLQVAAELGDQATKKFEPAKRSWTTEVQNSQNIIHRRMRAKEAEGQQLGMRMWEIVKQEQRLKNWEDLPLNIAKAIRSIRKLEVRVYQFTQMYNTKYSFQLRSHNVPVTDEVECKQMGRFDIPVEFAKRKEDSSPDYYAELEARLTHQSSPIVQ